MRWVDVTWGDVREDDVIKVDIKKRVDMRKVT